MIDGGEFVIILVIAVVLIGPKNLPRYADQLAQFVRRVRKFITDTGSVLRKEMGADDIDFSQFDIRQYDPRRIVRETLLEDTPFANPNTRPRPAATPARKASVVGASGAAGGAGSTVATVSSATTSEVAGAQSSSPIAVASHSADLNFDDQAT